MTFFCGSYYGKTEMDTNAVVLGQIKISASTSLRFFSSLIFLIFSVEGKKSISVDKVHIQCATGCDNWTNLELSCQCLKGRSSAFCFCPGFIDFLFWNQKFSGNLIAEFFNFVIGRLKGIEVEDSCLSQP